MYQVYVIRNADWQHYTGLSEDVGVRLAQHNDGESKWTRNKGPWKLVWISDILSLTDARKLENFLKKQKGTVPSIRPQSRSVDPIRRRAGSPSPGQTKPRP